MRASPALRRRWLLGAAAFGTMSLGGLVVRAASRSENPRERMRNRLISLLQAPERARQLGVIYLQSPAGQLALPSALTDSVLTEIGPNAGIEAIRRHIATRIRRELAEVQVISLDGWIMSMTEAQLCALVAAGRMP
jgi:hypothetical protein